MSVKECPHGGKTFHTVPGCHEAWTCDQHGLVWFRFPSGEPCAHETALAGAIGKNPQFPHGHPNGKIVISPKLIGDGV